MSTTSEFRKQVLETAPRLKLDDRFRFACHSGVQCFNQCCANINIFLTPYDVLRLKQRLGITSTELLDKYTVVPFNKEIKQPVPLIRMRDDEGKACPFVGEQGCTVYEDRPWACRMYPLGMAAPRDEVPPLEGGRRGDEKRGQGESFYFLMEEEHCRGFEEKREYSVGGWIDDQGVQEYNEAGELFKPITLHPFFEGNDVTPPKMDMFFMVAYDLDRFRRFVFDSSFLHKFAIEPEVVEAMRESDFELMKFGFRWLRFALAYEPTVKLNPKYDPAAQKERDFFQRPGPQTGKQRDEF